MGRSLAQLFLSTLSLRRATPALHNILKLLPISIHALLTESDRNDFRRVSSSQEFLSTLSLRRATASHTNLPGKIIFLSTLSLRRATVKVGENLMNRKNFYPRSPYGERLSDLLIVTVALDISIHALLTESDQAKALKIAAHGISIHALLTESDSKSAQNSGALLRI